MRHPRRHLILHGFIAWLCAGAVVASLSACGGGGGGKAPEPITPSTTPAPATGRYAAALTREVSSSGKTSAQVQVISLDTSAVVRTYALNGDGTDAYHVTPLATVVNGAAVEFKGASQLFMIQNGRVMQVDLRGPTLGTLAQVSNLTNACKFIDTLTAVPSPTGADSWMTVQTAGADGQCSQIDDNREVLVRGGMGAEVAPILSGTQGLEVIDTIEGTSDGVSAGVLVWDHSGNQLCVYGNDLQTCRQTVDVPEQPLTPGITVTSLGAMAQGPQDLLLKIGSKLYRANHSNDTLTISPALYTLANASEVPLTAIVGADTYAITSTEVIKIAGGTSAQRLAKLTSANGPVDNVFAGAGHVVVAQTLTSGSTEQGTITAIPLNGQAAKVLTSRSDVSLGLLGVQGSDALVTAFDSDTGWSDVVRFPLSGASATTALRTIRVFSVALGQRYSLTDAAAPQWLVYCQSGSGSQFCAGNALHSFNVVTGTDVTLGTLPAAPGWTYSLGLIDDLTPQRVAGMATVAPLALLSVRPSTSATQLWQFNPSQADSLVRVTQLP